MKTYIIIDNLGKRHATIKAKDRVSAIKEYILENMPNNLVMAILSEDIETFKNNIESL